MNTRILAAALAVSFCLAACDEYDPGEGFALDYSDEEMAVLNSFTSNFIKRYGTIDPVHSWGFEELEAQAELKTRKVYTNRNEWTAAIKEDNVIVEYSTTSPKPDPWNSNAVVWNAEGEVLDIPGFPSDVDGKYYVEGNTQADIVVYNNQDELIATGKNSFSPVGDVTEEEILYVSNWFRSNPNPGSIEVELTDFFIQDISQDQDRISYPDGAYDSAKSNQVPVYDGEGNLSGYSNVAYGMDYFSVHTSAADPEHINNFNKDKANKIAELYPNDPSSYGEQELRNRTIMWWNTDGGVTTDFSYHNSDDDATYDRYVLVYLSFDGPQTGLHYEGYYLAFDYEYKKTDSEGKTATIEPDGYYSNWIVKLSPGQNIPVPPTANKTESRRVMCEDLGNTYDFDFNDLVFDVYYTYDVDENDANVKSNIKAHITVQAAGGTLPIYIGQVDDAHEAHKVMGATSTNVAINVGGERRNAATITLPANDTNPNNIDIYVESVGNPAMSTVTLLPKSGASASIAPQKICVPVSTKWLKENQQIEYGYPDFDAWVSDQRTEWWNSTVIDSYLY